MADNNSSNNQQTPSQPQGTSTTNPAPTNSQPERVVVPAIVMEVRNGSHELEKKGKTK